MVCWVDVKFDVKLPKVKKCVYTVCSKFIVVLQMCSTYLQMIAKYNTLGLSILYSS